MPKLSELNDLTHLKDVRDRLLTKKSNLAKMIKMTGVGGVITTGNIHQHQTTSIDIALDEAEFEPIKVLLAAKLERRILEINAKLMAAGIEIDG